MTAPFITWPHPFCIPLCLGYALAFTGCWRWRPLDVMLRLPNLPRQFRHADPSRNGSTSSGGDTAVVNVPTWLQVVSISVSLLWVGCLAVQQQGPPPAAFTFPVLATGYLTQLFRGGAESAGRVWAVACFVGPIAGIFGAMLRPSESLAAEIDMQLALRPLTALTSLSLGYVHSVQPYGARHTPPVQAAALHQDQASPNKLPAVGPSAQLLFAMVVIGLYSLVLTVTYIRTQDERWVNMVRRSPSSLAASP